MKKLFGLILLVAFLASCNQQTVKDSFTIKGNTDNDVSGMVYLQKRQDRAFISIDSVQAVENKFEFTGTIDFPQVYYINIPETKSLVPFFIENSDIQIDLDTETIDNTKITGSASQDEYETYLNMLDKYEEKLSDAYTLYKKANELNEQDKIEMYDSIMYGLQKEREAFIVSYLQENGSLSSTPYIAYRNSYSFDIPQLESILNGFDESLQASVYLPPLTELLETMKSVDIGQPYVNFTQPDTSGLFIPVASLVGEKYLLIDFWASWCSPCRAENPNLVAIYNDYKGKGFEILGVSFDTKKENWTKAIRDDKLIWPQISDIKGWNNAAGKLYGIRSIPSNVLLDKDGTIIEKNLRGDELRGKLEEIFNTGV